MSDDRPSNAHLSVNHTRCRLDRSGEKKKRLIVDIEKVTFFTQTFKCSLNSHLFILRLVHVRNKSMLILSSAVLVHGDRGSGFHGLPVGGTGAPAFLPRAKNTRV